MFTRAKSARWPWVTLLAISAMAVGCKKTTNTAERTARPMQEVARGETLEPDARRAIAVEPATRLAVLTEMRTMLKAVQGVVYGAATGDTAAIRAAAASAGVKAASEANAAIETQLGVEFVQLGMRTHVAFDSLALDLARGRSSTDVLRGLSTVMGNCVGCHEQWRLTVR